MRGCLMAAPSKLDPVMKMPLQISSCQPSQRRLLKAVSQQFSGKLSSHELGRNAAHQGCSENGEAHALAYADGAPEVGADVLEQEEQVRPVDRTAVVWHLGHTASNQHTSYYFTR